MNDTIISSNDGALEEKKSQVLAEALESNTTLYCPLSTQAGRAL